MSFKLERRGMLLVISAPSGGGKSEVLRRLLASDPAIDYSVSYTSRPKRGSETDGRDYHFINRESFEKKIEADNFYEWAEVHENLYGTSVRAVDDAMDRGRDIAMDLDIQGGLSIKKRRPDAVLIFLLPPSMQVLEERLRGRQTDSEDVIQLRLRNAAREIDHWPIYDYVVKNDNIEQTVEQVNLIVQAERLRASRLTHLRLAKREHATSQTHIPLAKRQRTSEKIHVRVRRKKIP